MKKILAPLALLGVFALAACGPQGPPPPTFEESCEAKGGVFMEDSTTKAMTGWVYGTITGTVFAGGQSTIGTGTGSALVTSPVTFTIRHCVVDGKIVDVELE